MSKFFEAVKRTETNLNGVELPFTTAEIPGPPERLCQDSNVPSESVDPTRSPGAPLQAPAGTERPVPSATYRTVRIRISAQAPILPFDGSHLNAAEHYRMIRTKIVQHPANPRVLCISSTSMGDGKTVSSLNIASSLALKHGSTALLVDVDLRRPQLATLLGLADRPGLADVLAGTCTLEQAIVQIAELPSLYFLPAGFRAQNPAELLDSDGWRNLIASFRRDFDFTVMDSPPVGIVTDYDLIQAVCDGVALIARPGHSDRALLQKGVAQMPRDKFLGLVVNCTEDWFLWHPHPNYYGSYYTKAD